MTSFDSIRMDSKCRSFWVLSIAFIHVIRIKFTINTNWIRCIRSFIFWNNCNYTSRVCPGVGAVLA
jgi:hypothetical protein